MSNPPEDLSKNLPVPIGSVVAGKYRLEEVLGAGGMAIVYGATHLQLEQPVAIKMIRTGKDKPQAALQRFAREARVAARIRNRHVVNVMDVGELEAGAPYIVMEYLHGTDLAEAARVQGAFPVSEAVAYILQACEAVAAAHAVGVVHRDLKPSNLFLAEQPDGSVHVKVLDFGISKVALSGGEGDLSLTTDFEVLGSPLFMAPEQMVSSRNVDARADIWSLGIILFKLLTGSTPFRAANVAELCMCVLHDRPAPLRSLRPELPASLERVIERCLRAEPAKRFANVGDLARALAEHAPSFGPAAASRIARLLGFATATPTAEEALLAAETGGSESVPTIRLDSPGDATMAGWVPRSLPDRNRTSARRIGTGALLGAVLASAVVWAATHDRADPQSRDTAVTPASAQRLLAPARDDVAAAAAPAPISEPASVPSASIPSNVTPAIGHSERNDRREHRPRASASSAPRRTSRQAQQTSEPNPGAPTGVAQPTPDENPLHL